MVSRVPTPPETTTSTIGVGSRSSSGSFIADWSEQILASSAVRRRRPIQKLAVGAVVDEDEVGVVGVEGNVRGARLLQLVAEHLAVRRPPHLVVPPHCAPRRREQTIRLGVASPSSCTVCPTSSMTPELVPPVTIHAFVAIAAERNPRRKIALLPRVVVFCAAPVTG